jgi:hypothetical protein
VIDVQQVEDPNEGDDELGIDEAWKRVTDRFVQGARAERIGDHWLVTVDVMQCIREDPLEGELRRRIDAALRSVKDATAVEEEDRETWVVGGSPSGAALVRAVAQVADDLGGQVDEALAAADRRDERPERQGLHRALQWLRTGTRLLLSGPGRPWVRVGWAASAARGSNPVNGGPPDPGRSRGGPSGRLLRSMPIWARS